MKRIITLMSFCLFAGMMFGQNDPALKVSSVGNVGVNTGTPESKLHVKGGDILLESSLVTSKRVDTGVPQQVFGMDANDDMTINRGSILSGQNSSMLFGVGANKYMYVFGPGIQPLMTIEQSTGNVGIGTTTPTFTLELGAGATAAKPGGGVWAGTSDKRAKKNIKSFDQGLEEVLKINPVTYKYNGKFGTSDDNSQYVGIIAQEMQKIAPYTVKEATHVDKTIEYLDSGLRTKTNKEENYLTFDGTAITYMLVNAVKTQNEMIEGLKDENTELRELVNEALQSIKAIKETRIDASLIGENEVPKLNQNTPNPFNGQTEMAYFIPAQASKASITITNIAGQVIKTIDISHKGNGVLDLNAQDMPVGTYQYTLSVDGKLVDTKKMALIR